jgi:hypothetical protein
MTATENLWPVETNLLSIRTNVLQKNVSSNYVMVLSNVENKYCLSFGLHSYVVPIIRVEILVLPTDKSFQV